MRINILKSSMALCLVAATFCLTASLSMAQPVLNSPVVSPEILPDHSVVFRLSSPNASQVTIMGDTKVANESLRLVWIGVGSEETGGIPPNRQAHEFLESKGIKHEFAIVPCGIHSWLS